MVFVLSTAFMMLILVLLSAVFLLGFQLRDILAEDVVLKGHELTDYESKDLECLFGI